MYGWEEILLRLAAGDPQAFKEIYQAYYTKVRAFANGFLKDADETEEVTQIVFVKVWDKREMFGNVQNFDSYLFRLTKYTIFNYIEAKRLIPTETEEMPAQMDMDTPYEDVVAHDLELLIELVVSNMPPQRQLIFRMSRFEGLSNADISEKLGIQKKTVENHLNAALKELKNIIPIAIIAYRMLIE